MATILISGNPVDGFTYTGPFASSEDAISYAEAERWDGDWWVAEMTNPTPVAED